MRVERVTNTYDSPYNPKVQLQNANFGFKRSKAAYGESEVEIEGKNAILVADSEKYGKEIVFQNYSPNFKLRNRGNDSKWNRMEWFFPYEQALQLAKAIKLLHKEAEF